MLELAAAGLVFGVLFAFFCGGWAFAANREIQNAWAYGLLPVLLFFWLGAWALIVIPLCVLLIIERDQRPKCPTCNTRYSSDLGSRCAECEAKASEVRTRCSKCKATLKAPLKAKGRQFHCKRCGEKATVEVFAA